MSRAYISPLKAKARRRKQVFAIFGLTIFIAIGLGYWFTRPEKPIIRPTSSPQATSPKPGATPVVNRVVGQDPVISYTSEQALGLIKLTNPAFTGSVPSLKQQTFRYTMTDTDGKTATVYARLFIPAQSSVNRMPIIGFAPGTTGIDDKCAASVEVPAKRNWANYESHMLSYAAAGYAVVITDYEGMRDASRMHHYMVGVLEGRALLDAVRSINELPTAKGRVDPSSVILAGYSQGGHAAYWADKIATSYAPELTTKAVIGFGPVTDVQQTLTDVVRGANILWFGPYVLYSYADWYSENYSVPTILNPPFAANLSADIAKNCIDTNIGYWGNKDINKVYTKQFQDAMRQNSLAQYSPQLTIRLMQNLTADVKTDSRKLINHGKLDNVVLPGQSDIAFKRLCGLGNAVNYRLYADATHYSTMARSYVDTVNWLKTVLAGAAPPSDCR